MAHAYDGGEWHVVFDSEHKGFPWRLKYPDGGGLRNHSVVYETARDAWEQAKRLARKYRGRAFLHRKDGSAGDCVSYTFRPRAA
jgi:hypothetical protein